MKLKPVTSRRSVNLDDDHASVGGPVKSGKALERAAEKQAKRISKEQRVLYADGRYSLLIVLQGRDASGKDGTIKKVFSAVNPMGCIVTSFKAPTELEQRHDFLWRVHAQAPAHGMIGIFNRSHYEDVIVPRVHGWITKKVCAARYDQINDFEEMLGANRTVILKFLLHISREEQKRRLQERLTDETKNWKFRLGDLKDREKWDDFTEAYESALRHTSTKWAPWYIVPADDNDLRDWLIGRVIADAMEKLDLKYPSADPAVLKVKVD